MHTQVSIDTQAGKFAGVPHVRDEIKPRGFWDYDYMVDRAATEPAFRPPGTRQGNHGITMAWTVGELIHRVAKRRLARGQSLIDSAYRALGYRTNQGGVWTT